MKGTFFTPKCNTFPACTLVPAAATEGVHYAVHLHKLL